MEKNPVYIVYYREIPEEIEEFVKNNDNFSYVKDGVHQVDKNHSSPRLTIYYYGDKHQNKEKIQELWWLIHGLKIRGSVIKANMVEGNL